MVKVPHLWDSLPPPPPPNPHMLSNITYEICTYMHLWHWAYGLYTEHPGPIIRNGMGPVIEKVLMVACVTTMLISMYLRRWIFIEFHV